MHGTQIVFMFRCGCVTRIICSNFISVESAFLEFAPSYFPHRTGIPEANNTVDARVFSKLFQFQLPSPGQKEAFELLSLIFFFSRMCGAHEFGTVAKTQCRSSQKPCGMRCELLPSLLFLTLHCIT